MTKAANKTQIETHVNHLSYILIAESRGLGQHHTEWKSRSGSPATGPLAMVNASYNRLDNLGVTSQNADFQRYMFPNVSKMFTLYTW